MLGGGTVNRRPLCKSDGLFVACSRCSKLLPQDMFSTSNLAQHRYNCKPCTTVRNKLRYQMRLRRLAASAAGGDHQAAQGAAEPAPATPSTLDSGPAAATTGAQASKEGRTPPTEVLGGPSALRQAPASPAIATIISVHPAIRALLSVEGRWPCRDEQRPF
jgi:hypothetical protein